MKQLASVVLASLLALSSVSVLASKPKSFQATGSDFKVTLYPTLPCTSAKVADVLKKVNAPIEIKDMVKAKIVFQGKNVNGCAQLAGPVVLVVGEDGNGSVMPSDMFAGLTEV